MDLASFFIYLWSSETSCQIRRKNLWTDFVVFMKIEFVFSAGTFLQLWSYNFAQNLRKNWRTVCFFFQKRALMNRQCWNHKFFSDYYRGSKVMLFWLRSNAWKCTEFFFVRNNGFFHLKVTIFSIQNISYPSFQMMDTSLKKNSSYRKSNKTLWILFNKILIQNINTIYESTFVRQIMLHIHGDSF